MESTSLGPSSTTLDMDVEVDATEATLTGMGEDEFSLFRGEKITGNFTLAGVFLLNGKYMTDFSELFMAILLWMGCTYVLVHVVAAATAMVKLRNHPYCLFVSLPLLLMCVIGPCTIGAITSASLAFALHTGRKWVSPWHCAFLGIIQTIILVFVSFTRVVASL